MTKERGEHGWHFLHKNFSCKQTITATNHIHYISMCVGVCKTSPLTFFLLPPHLWNSSYLAPLQFSPSFNSSFIRRNEELFICCMQHYTKYIKSIATHQKTAGFLKWVWWPSLWATKFTVFVNLNMFTVTNICCLSRQVRHVLGNTDNHSLFFIEM